jgi:hypothetical protein
MAYFIPPNLLGPWPHIDDPSAFLRKWYSQVHDPTLTVKSIEVAQQNVEGNSSILQYLLQIDHTQAV